MARSEEMVEILDSMGRPLGSGSRRMANRVGLWHLCVQCWIITQDDRGEPALVFQRRSGRKSVSPGVLDVSASGHVSYGESPASAAIREIREELGVHVDEADLKYAGRRVDMFEAPGICSRIFAEVFFCTWLGSLADIIIDENELSHVCTISIEDGLRLFNSSVGEVNSLIRDESGRSEIRTVFVSDFLPRFDRYYLKAFNVADQLVRGLNKIYI